MLLPDVDQAVIEPAKIRDYLLASAHPAGGSKATYFLAHGYQRTNWQILANDLRGLAETGDATPDRVTRHGTDYVVTGVVQTPRGTHVRIRTIWIIPHGERAPRFVTAYPMAR